MNEILKTKLFRLLSEPSQVTNEEIQNAYGCFMEQVETVSQSEQDFLKVIRMLNIAHVELVFIKAIYQHEEGKKCAQICLSAKSNPIP